MFLTILPFAGHLLERTQQKKKKKKKKERKKKKKEKSRPIKDFQSSYSVSFVSADLPCADTMDRSSKWHRTPDG